MSNNSENQLIELCRTIMKEDLEIDFISFRVVRDDGEYQTFSTSRKPKDTQDG